MRSATFKWFHNNSDNSINNNEEEEEEGRETIEKNVAKY